MTTSNDPLARYVIVVDSSVTGGQPACGASEDIDQVDTIECGLECEGRLFMLRTGTDEPLRV
ncbi:hypothetical protein ACFLTC_01705 [Chloroflexota bacterium]